ncbi:PEP/pyruvate-binding domain-containing protein [Corynebacterium sp.]|uniref:PEP/pyruvate-binding domain-containing protein n=1 Tax=Corynebacterium sp. TaxID=1720 RepID=UPI0026DC14DE|nr:PEP/pyruvate-binding domain-containing protein [Corynebacterium sp.]MDO4914462.1 PEP/pyruvate-binding domain-containing protein [Corynebacterium sp.]
MIIDFKDATLASGGGKSVNLGELQRAGYPVPDGFVITADVYRDLVAEIDIRALLAESSKAVRSAIETQPIPKTLERELRARLKQWGDNSPVAVRSSATAEDLPTASFAGQQETYLGVTGPNEIMNAVRRCWGSLWTERAIQYRELNGFDHLNVALSVVVQRLVDADTAGVMFTQNPITGDCEVLINASWGLGESIVSGAVSPDEYRATPGEIIERTLGAKKIRIDRIGAAIRQTDVSQRNQQRLCLEDKQVLALAQLGRDIERKFGTPMDIEWAYANGELWLLQARPITTKVKHTPNHKTPTATVTGRRIAKASVLFHTDLIEHYPGPFPLDLAAIIPMHHQLQSVMSSIGIVYSPIERLINMTGDGAISVSYPDVKLNWRIVRLLFYSGPDPATWPVVEQHFRARLSDALPSNLDSIPDQELIPLLNRVLGIVNEIAKTRFLDFVGPAQFTGIRLGFYLRLARRSDLTPYDLLNDLSFVTADINQGLRTLATLDPESPEFNDKFGQFLGRYGARTPQMYLPFSHRSWQENPDALKATIDAIRPGRMNRTPQSHEQLANTITHRLPKFLRAGFARTLSTWRYGHTAREASVYLIEEAYVIARRVTDEIARRLTLRRFLPATDFIKYLTIEEIGSILDGVLTPEHSFNKATARAHARPTAASAWWVQAAPTNKDKTIKGAAGSPGKVTGRARIVTSPDEFGLLEPGDILVCQYTDPSWTPLFNLAAGVVSDTGGRLSHASIVAREYGIPAVMGTAEATTSITDGQTISIDGDKGIVILT